MQKPALKWSPAPVVIFGFSMNGPYTAAVPVASAAAAKDTG